MLFATQGDLAVTNLFAYCANNPVTFFDPSGYALSVTINFYSARFYIGHTDISFGGYTYAYGAYGNDYSYRNAILGRCRGRINYTTNGTWFSYQNYKGRALTRIWIDVNSKERARIGAFYKNIMKNATSRKTGGTLNNKIKWNWTQYTIRVSPYNKYYLLWVNCEIGRAHV